MRWASSTKWPTLGLRLADACDLAVAAYICSTTPGTPPSIRAMCRPARGLKPGGRFVTVNQSAALDFRAAPSYRTYGFRTTALGECGSAAPINMDLLSG